MNTASILVKTEPKIKDEAKKIAKELGLSLSSVITRLLKEFIKTKTLTLSAKELGEVPNEYFKKELKQALKDREEGKASPIFKNADEAINWLEKQGI